MVHRQHPRVRRAASARGSGTGDPDTAPLSVTPRRLILHAVGAALALLFVALIATPRL